MVTKNGAPQNDIHITLSLKDVTRYSFRDAHFTAPAGQNLKLYEYLNKTIPGLGIVLDCCTKPSHDLGREGYFNSMFQEMKDFLVQNGVGGEMVACPNCFKIFHYLWRRNLHTDSI